VDEELKEWLGITKADGLIYLSFALAIIGYFVNNITIISFMYIIAIISGVSSIKYGSGKKKEVSKLTNVIKKYVYHFSLFIVIVMIIFRYFLYS